MPLRGIVTVRPRSWPLPKLGAKSVNYGPAVASAVESVGARFDPTYSPLVVAGRYHAVDTPVAASAHNYAAPPTTVYCLRAEFDDEEAAQRLLADRRGEVLGVYADLPIAHCGAYCATAARGDAVDAAAMIGLGALSTSGMTGRGVRVAIVDEGIDASRVSVIGGGDPNDPSYQPGSSPSPHGSMVAFNAALGAPDGDYLDWALLRATPTAYAPFLSDAIAVFTALTDLITSRPGALVVNNSWSVYDRAGDAPVGSPANYCSNALHPLNQAVSQLVAAGADVFFAAGNCGSECAVARCGPSDRGPGASIHGANSHPDVITVAAVTIDGERLGLSSQGPGGLHQRKPDVAAPSHFIGSDPTGIDTGTSAASPLAAGIASAVRQRFGPEVLSPAQLKTLIQRSARGNTAGWDADIGHGVVDARRLLQLLSVA